MDAEDMWAPQRSFNASARESQCVAWWPQAKETWNTDKKMIKYFNESNVFHDSLVSPQATKINLHDIKRVICAVSSDLPPLLPFFLFSSCSSYTESVHWIPFPRDIVDCFNFIIKDRQHPIIEIMATRGRTKCCDWVVRVTRNKTWFHFLPKT